MLLRNSIEMFFPGSPAVLADNTIDSLAGGAGTGIGRTNSALGGDDGPSWAFNEIFNAAGAPGSTTLTFIPLAFIKLSDPNLLEYAGASQFR